MKTNRRQFLTRTALGVGSALLAPRLLADPKPAPKYFDPYEAIPLGGTKLKCSRVILGTGMKGGNRQSNHTRINPYGMSMDGPPEKVVPVLKKIHTAGKGVVGMKIIGEGRLRNDPEKRQASIKFALELGCVDVLNVGCESIAEVEDLAAGIKKVQRSA